MATNNENIEVESNPNIDIHVNIDMQNGGACTFNARVFCNGVLVAEKPFCPVGDGEDVPIEEIRFADGCIFFGKMEVQMQPKEYAIYKYFFDHPEGVSLRDLVELYADEFKDNYYAKFSTKSQTEVKNLNSDISGINHKLQSMGLGRKYKIMVEKETNVRFIPISRHGKAE